MFKKISVYIDALRYLVSKTSSDIAESHIILQKNSLYMSINTIVRHGNIDIPLLNATAVSDFKKTLRKKQTMQ